MKKFEPVSAQVSLPELEEKTTQFWKENKTFEKSVEKNSADNLYTFVDGPPFVSGLPHYGHLLTSIAKDMIPRYQTMNGKRVRRVWGWDCHGLPIEEKVNKLYGIKSSQQLEEEFGIEKYIAECRNYVQSTSSDWRWYVDRIGRWVDIDNAYYTMNIEFMESVIWAFKQIHDKGLIYKGKRVSLFSTDTSTPVSQFEVAMDPDNYQEVEDLSIFVKFELADIPGNLQKTIKDQKVYLLAWTTTPWTIPANFALSVNPKFKYVLVEYDSQFFILAEDRLEYTFGSLKEIKVIEEVKGKDLEGTNYKPVYEYFINESTSADFKVYLSDEVTVDEGTGVVHSSPAFGESDFQMAQKYGISSHYDIDDEGKMTIDPWKGIYLRDASPLIAEDLQEKGNLLRSEAYKHRLPFYRGANPLIYMAQEAYFIDIQKIKNQMLKLNQDINWIPKHLKDGRFGNTVETSPDWCISRNRYWATIMPIWKNEDGDEIVIGSIEEMLQYTNQITKKEEDGKVSYFFENKPMDLHRDVCDKIILEKDGKKYTRIPEVLDCWMDSGSVPFAEYHYPFENEQSSPASQDKATLKKPKQADFIIEYIAQVRAWFNVLLRLSTIIFDQSAFKNAISHGTIAGTDGRKMSKSYGNYPDPKMLLEKFGGDALRAYFMSSPVMRGEDINFSEEEVGDNYKFLLVFWNSYKFFTDYAIVNNWSSEKKDLKNLTILDKWILSKLNQLIIDVRKSFDSYDVVNVTSSLKSFITNDFSTWYIRRSRDRVGNEAEEKDKNVTLSVMYEVLVTLTKLMAPVTPFITEEMFKNLTGEESVHLQDYPVADKSILDEKLIADMVILRKVVEKGHALRKDSNIKLRQPLASIIYKTKEKIDQELEQILADELNVKSVEYAKSEKEDFEVEIDTNITPDLKDEGDARDLIREIQKLRKEAGLTLSDKTEVEAPSWPEKFESEILKKTSSVKISKGEVLKVTKV